MTVFKEHTICCNYTVNIEQSVNAHVKVKPTAPNAMVQDQCISF